MVFLTFNLLKRASLLLGVGLAFSCGKSNERYASELREIPVQGLSLDLASDTSDAIEGVDRVLNIHQLRIEVVGCLSGYRVMTSGGEPLKLYRGDQSCRVKLHSFNIFGEEFLSNQPLEGVVGDSEIFYSSTRELRVYIAQMIKDPVSAEDQISYTMSTNLEEGKNQDVLSMIRGASCRVQRLQSSTRIPHFKLDKFSYLKAIPNSKSFGIGFDIECFHPMKWSGTPASLTCGNVRLKDLSYVLVQDIYNSAPTVKILNSIFKNGAVKVDETADYYRPSLAHNGGFKTNRKTQLLKSPNDTSRNNKMLLILRSFGGYQYFNVDIDVGR